MTSPPPRKLCATLWGSWAPRGPRSLAPLPQHGPVRTPLKERAVTTLDNRLIVSKRWMGPVLILLKETRPAGSVASPPPLPSQTVILIFAHTRMRACTRTHPDTYTQAYMHTDSGKLLCSLGPLTMSSSLLSTLFITEKTQRATRTQTMIFRSLNRHAGNLSWREE